MTTERIGNCISCVLIPLVLGLAVLFGGYWLIGKSTAERIEDNLSYTSNQLLKGLQVDGVIVNMDGRDAILAGTVKSTQRSEEIENLLTSLSGIHAVDNQFIMASAPVIGPEPVAKPTPATETETETEIAHTQAPEVKALAQLQAVEKIQQTLDLLRHHIFI